MGLANESESAPSWGEVAHVAFVTGRSTDNFKTLLEIRAPEHLTKVDIPLNDFAEKVWIHNKENDNPNISPNRKISDLQNTTVGDKPAYQFSLTEIYNNGFSEGQVLKEEYTYILTEHNAKKFEIFFPKSEESAAQAILATLKFLETTQL